MRLRQRLVRRVIATMTLNRLFVFLGVILCLLVYGLKMGYRSSYDGEEEEEDAFQLGLAAPGEDDEDSLPSCNEMTYRVTELLRIRRSVRTELRSLEQRRGLMQSKINELGRQIEALKNEAHIKTTELERLQVSLKTSQLARDEFNKRNTPEIHAPFRLRASSPPKPSPPQSLSSCSSMSDCFDYSRCSLTSGFPTYNYNTSLSPKDSKHASKEACLFIVTDPVHPSSLPFWAGDGRNHLIIYTRNSYYNMMFQHNIHKAIIATNFSLGDSFFRPGFDVSIPPIPPSSYERGGNLPPPPLHDIVPLRRPYLVSHPFEADPQSSLFHYVQLIQHDQTDDRVQFFNNSDPSPYEKSTFTLLDTLHPEFQFQLSDVLTQGSIPVIVFPETSPSAFPELILPFGEMLDWKLASVFLPYARIPELHFLLRSYPDSDLFYLKRQGRLILQEYFEDPINTGIHIVRERIGLPPPDFPEAPSISIFNETFKKGIMEEGSLPPDYEPSEPLGPLEPPFPSPAYRRNFSSLALHHYNTWNIFFKPFRSAPFTPWEPSLPTEAKFLGSSGFRPINEGTGGTGAEFSRALGGNAINEQFTIVLLTYEREQVLINSLSRLYGLPYLNKVIVVWNSPGLPPEDLAWPEIGVEILVIKAEKNSLNNRFQPFEAIQTEAVLSIDDDAHLRHDEIIFGFRVWRENRDRLVGFPGRFHAWDSLHSSWNYNSNYSCELSMVLTGAAFYHKYYSYLYTYEMPQAIRSKVDEYMNCEDLAMNFLVSHVTRKPPVKVTSRWTFRCPGCPVSLSEDDSHFIERHACINFFKEVYGYMPLLYTQYRADSVLFKTRIPPDKQKCFKFI